VFSFFCRHVAVGVVMMQVNVGYVHHLRGSIMTKVEPMFKVVGVGLPCGTFWWFEIIPPGFAACWVQILKTHSRLRTIPSSECNDLTSYIIVRLRSLIGHT
jgi:hypothetical protein